MRDLVLSDKEFLPERTNVLSEFDMYNGDPNFALSVGICSTAFLCHPYGHETIGFLEDIENYTTAKLKEFYDSYYCPNNAVLMIIGDIDENKALEEVNKYFGHIPKNTKLPIRSEIREPKQEGVRRIDINRPGTTHVLAIGVKHGGFPSSDWYETALALELLAQGEDSILHKKLVDTGLATSVSVSQEPTKDTNVAIISVVLTKKTTHEKMETLFKKIISEVDESYIKKVLPTLVTKNLTDEVFNRDSSLSIASELTEFVAAGDWSAFFNTENSLKKINSKQVLKKITELFTENNLTIGYYKSF
jgi:zinc protease